jgi:hypothetical protein
MPVPSQAEERLRQAYELLRDLLEQDADSSPRESAIAYLPPLPPIDPGSRLSATDLLSSWFRPPSGHADPWQSFFRKYEASAATPLPALPTPNPVPAFAGPPYKGVMRALFPEDEDELASDDADAAVEAFYEFLHAFGRHDIDGAMRFVAADYHTFADDLEIDRGDLRNHLEALLESLHGWNFEVSLSMAPEPMAHPYGIIIYAEIQIDAVHPVSSAKRNYVERRLALVQLQEDSQWRLAALSPVRLGTA